MCSRIAARASYTGSFRPLLRPKDIAGGHGRDIPRPDMTSRHLQCTAHSIGRVFKQSTIAIRLRIDDWLIACNNIGDEVTSRRSNSETMAAKARCEIETRQFFDWRHD